MTDIFAKRFLVDTNILVYYFDEKSEFHDAVFSFLKKCIEKQVFIYIAQQNLIELSNVFLKDYKKNKEDIVKILSQLQREEMIKVILPLSTTTGLFIEILQGRDRNQIFDLYLAATAIDNGITNIVTNNPKDFVNIANFKAFGLKELGGVLKI